MGDSVALPAVAPAVAVVEAAVAPGRAALVSDSPSPRPESEGREDGIAVGPALAVAVPAGSETGPKPTPAPSPASPQPEAAPAPEPVSAPIAPPSPAPEAQGPRHPVAAGAPGFPGEEEGEESCAGDEYTLTITPLETEGEAVKILLEHVTADGNVETLELEGDLEDARSLVLRLSAEGGCVEVEVVSGDDGEEAMEAATAPPPTPTP